MTDLKPQRQVFSLCNSFNSILQEVEELKNELETCESRLDSKYKAIDILRKQVKNDLETCESRLDSKYKAIDILRKQVKYELETC